ncbi:hypothetical protein [Janthinobacterium sp. 13]|nr:hypothetical protein [Janthinobacterium sp. 13]PIF12899.1 hypothetical protein CLU94_4999 [Janthinobacterium sp. 13]
MTFRAATAQASVVQALLALLYAAMREVAVFAFDGAQFAVYGDAIVAQ